MKLIVGLGNPGPRYARNRHNIGFMVAERLVERRQLGPWRSRFQGEVAAGEIGGEKVLVLKPQTYMNESGRAVGEAARFLKLTTADLIVIHDELDLEPGRVKVKRGGGNAGHNGLRSITAHLDNEYTRVRLGIGHPGAKELVQHWVLSDFAKRDAEWLDPLLDAVVAAMDHLVTSDAARFTTAVARALGDGGGSRAADARTGTPDGDMRAKAVVSEGPRPAVPAPAHPAGERAGKRASALANNLKRWLERRKPKD